MRRPRKPTVIGTVTVGPIGEDARFPKPFFFTVKNGDLVEHERFYEEAQAEHARAIKIMQLQSARRRRRKDR